MSSPITSPFGTMPQVNPQSPTSSIPTGGGGGNVGDASQMLIKLIQQASAGAQGNIQNRPQVMLPGQLPPQHHEAGDVSGNMVNSNTIGGPARNARVTMAASIGKLVANVENQQELKKARDIAFDMQRIQTAMQNPTPENQQLVNEILSDPKKRKEISSALNINFMGGEDKRKPHQKQGLDIWGQMNQNGGQQNGQPQGQAQGQSQQQQQPQQPNYFNRLQRMMPSAPQITPEASMYAEMVKLGIVPDSNEQLKAVTALVTNETKYNETIARLQTSVDIANAKNATAAQIQDAKNAQRTIDNLNRLHETQITANAHVAAASVTGQAHVAAAQIGADAKNRQTTVLAGAKQQLNTIQATKDQIDATTKTIKTLQDNLANKVGDKKAQTDLIKQLIDTNQKLTDSLKSVSGVSTSGNDGTNTRSNSKSSAQSDYQKAVNAAINGADDESEDDDEDEKP